VKEEELCDVRDVIRTLFCRGAAVAGPARAGVRFSRPRQVYRLGTLSGPGCSGSAEKFAISARFLLQSLEQRGYARSARNLALDGRGRRWGSRASCPNWFRADEGG